MQSYPSPSSRSFGERISPGLGIRREICWDVLSEQCSDRWRRVLMTSDARLFLSALLPHSAIAVATGERTRIVALSTLACHWPHFKTQDQCLKMGISVSCGRVLLRRLFGVLLFTYLHRLEQVPICWYQGCLSSVVFSGPSCGGLDV